MISKSQNKSKENIKNNNSDKNRLMSNDHLGKNRNIKVAKYTNVQDRNSSTFTPRKI